MSSEQWLSFHIFYHNLELFDEMILNAIFPIVHIIKLEKKASQFFFIRYWEGGPHIRLRFFTNPNWNEYIETLITEQMNNYFKKNPSTKKLDNKMKQEWYPNNSIHQIKYDPENVRYGGEKGMQIAQSLFLLSSEANFSILKSKPTSRQKHAIAQDLMLLTGLVMNETYDKLIVFLDRYSNYFKVFQQAKELEDKFLSDCNKSFGRQSEAILDRVKYLVSLHQNKNKTKDGLYYNWIKFHNQVLIDLRCLHLKGELLHPLDGSVIDSNNRMEAENAISIITQSYIHMNNNRLGLTPYDESYLAFMLSQGIKSVSKERDYVEYN